MYFKSSGRTNTVIPRLRFVSKGCTDLTFHLLPLRGKYTIGLKGNLLLNLTVRTFEFSKKVSGHFLSTISVKVPSSYLQ